MGNFYSKGASDEGKTKYLPETMEQRIREAEFDAKIARMELRRQIRELEKKKEDLEFEMSRVDERLAFMLAEITQEHGALDTQLCIPGSTLMDEPQTLMTIKECSLPSEEQVNDQMKVTIPRTASMDEEHMLMTASESSLPLQEPVVFVNSVQVDVPCTLSMDVPQTSIIANENSPQSEKQMAFVNTQVSLSGSELQTSLSVEEIQPHSEEVQAPDTVSACEPHSSTTVKEIFAQTEDTNVVTYTKVQLQCQPVTMLSSKQVTMTSKEFPKECEQQASMAVTKRQPQSISACRPHTLMNVKEILAQLEESMVITLPEFHIPVTMSASEQAAMKSKDRLVLSESETSMTATERQQEALLTKSVVISENEPQTAITSSSKGRSVQLQEQGLVHTQVYRPGKVLACESQSSITATERQPLSREPIVFSHPQILGTLSVLEPKAEVPAKETPTLLNELMPIAGTSHIQLARESPTATTKTILKDKYKRRKRSVQIDNPRVSLDNAGSSRLAKQPRMSVTDYTVKEKQTQCDESVQLGNSGFTKPAKQSLILNKETVPPKKHREKGHRKKTKTKATKSKKEPLIPICHTLTECKSEKTIHAKDIVIVKPFQYSSVSLNGPSVVRPATEAQALINGQIPAIYYQQYIKELRDSDQRILDYQYFNTSASLKRLKKKKKKN